MSFFGRAAILNEVGGIRQKSEFSNIGGETDKVWRVSRDKNLQTLCKWLMSYEGHFLSR